MTAIDPYRTLGLTPGASQAEIKRAYRHLAKLYHPDSAGDRALGRFLAIQAAYEALIDDQGRGRGYRRSASTTRTPQPPPSAPWQADASRARATREAFRARTRRAGTTPGAPPAGGPGAPSGDPSAGGPSAPGGPRPSRPGGGPSSRSGSTGGAAAGSGTGAGPTGGRRRRSRGPKATIGSTSYDGADKEPFDPAWEGATWYGAGSGTYWTLNPKEYADPRKHGPEYLARSRRQTLGATAAGESAADATPAGPADDDRPDGGSPDTGTSGERRSERAGTGSDPEQRPAGGPTPTGGATGRPSAGPTPTTRARPTSAPSALAGDTPSAGASDGVPGSRSGADGAGDARRADAGRAGPGVPPRPATAGTAAGAAGATVVRPVGAGSPPAFGPSPAFDPPSAAGVARAATTLPGRIIVAIVGWIPLGIGLSVATQVMPACTTTSLVCADPLKAGIWPLHLLIIGLLVAVPRLGLIAAYGTAAFLLIGFVATPVLIAIGGAQTTEGTAAVLRVILVAAWLGGIGLALSGRVELPPWRPSRTMRR